MISFFLLRGLHGPGLHHHLDLVLGARQQLDGSALAEAGPVHLEEDWPLVGLDAQRDGDVDDGGDAVHVRPAVGFSLSRLGGVGEGEEGLGCSGAPVEEEEQQGEDAEDAAVLRRDRGSTLRCAALPLWAFQNKSALAAGGKRSENLRKEYEYRC